MEEYLRRQQEAAAYERALRNRIAEGNLSAQQAKLAWDRYQDELARLERLARLEAEREAQRLSVATTIAGQLVGALSDALRYLAPPGSAEDLARGLSAVGTGQPVSFQPRTAPFPYNPLEIAPSVARSVLGWLRQQSPGYAAYLEQAAGLEPPGALASAPFTAPPVQSPSAPAAPAAEQPLIPPAVPLPGRGGPF